MSDDAADPLVSIDGLTKYFENSDGLLADLELDFEGGGFPVRYDRSRVQAVEDVSFDIRQGETLGLVGESGCGKSTLARVLLRLLEPTDGAVYFDGENLAEMGRERLRQRRRDVQMIFQDPQSSLDPRMKIGSIIEEPMKAHDVLDEAGRRERAEELLEAVGLEPQYYDRRPHEFSGGQRQRINLARALSVEPEFVVLDEPTSALDVSIQAQILELLEELQDEFDLTYLFISHDLSVIRYVSDRIAVMYLGELVEIGDKETVFADPSHPYTESLLSSIPVPDPKHRGERSVLKGDVPSPIDPPSGCRFRTRCRKLIAPAEYDLGDEEWDGVRRLMRAVERREFAADDPAEIRERFFDGPLTDETCEEVVGRALDLVANDEWPRATELLVETFAEPSVCAKRSPALESPDGDEADRRVACHRHNPPDGRPEDEVLRGDANV
ncbi:MULTISPECIES: ABC transporter ATP-binding protein [Halorussus]|uniref:ABC transporter ATP-binding protein n=1 Tax=Halorussus TaxID=1070314 RepID=UPI001F03C848|nr:MULTISPECIES: oligopeptide/dipeptide ABC transporter ATP-binding protein [Halorussus]